MFFALAAELRAGDMDDDNAAVAAYLDIAKHDARGRREPPLMKALKEK